MAHRPLIWILISYAGGIFVAYKIHPLHHAFLILILVLIVFSLLGALFLSTRFRFLCLLSTFFLTGTLIEQVKNSSTHLTPWVAQRVRATIEGTVLEPVQTIEGAARLRVKASRLLVEGRSISANDTSVSYTHLRAHET